MFVDHAEICNHAGIISINFVFFVETEVRKLLFDKCNFLWVDFRHADLLTDFFKGALTFFLLVFVVLTERLLDEFHILEWVIKCFSI